MNTRPTLQKILKEILHPEEESINTIMRACEKINPSRRVQMRNRKESNIINTINHLTSKVNKRSRKKHRLFKTTRRKRLRCQKQVVTLNINILNFPIKRQRLAQWIKKDTKLCFLTRKSSYLHRPIQTEGERMESDILSKWNPKASRNNYNYNPIKIDFKTIRRDKAGHYILIKGVFIKI